MRTNPGQTVCTVMPSGRRSILSASSMLISAAFVAPYASERGKPRYPATLAMPTIVPAPRRRMSGSTASTP